MKPTHHKLRLSLGLLTVGVGLFFIVPAIWIFFFSRGLVFPRFIDGIAWLLIGALLCFLPEFRLRLTRYKVTLVLGLLMTVAGLLFTVAAISVLFGSRPHGLLPFYEFIGVGPLLLTTGVLICVYPNDAG
jgi:hypothetical protein